MYSVEQERLVAHYVDIATKSAIGLASNELSCQHAQIEDARLLPPDCDECVSTVGDGWFAAQIDKSDAGSGVITFLVAGVDAVGVEIANHGASAQVDRLIRHEYR